MSDPSFALQTALYSALDTALSCPIYDSVPNDASYPYVTLDFEQSSNEDFVNSRMDRRFFYLAVWSDYPGQKEVKEIMAQIDTALHEKPLALSTGHTVSVRVDRKRTSREPDNRTFMGQVTLRILTQH